MKLRLKESIYAGGDQYLPPAVIDTKEVGISDDEANVLVRRGTAVVETETATEAPTEAPKTTKRTAKAAE